MWTVRRFRGVRLLLCIALASVIATDSWAATITYKIVPTDVQPNSAGAYEVAPGATLAYDLTAIITSDNLSSQGTVAVADNAGLAFFNVSILTDFGVSQPALDSFSLLIQQNFNTLPSLGTPTAPDDIIQVSASENTFSGVPVGGIAVGQDQVLATGHFQTPASEGTFHVNIGPNSAANVLVVGGQASVISAKLGTFPGITVQTVTPTTTPPPTTGGTDTTGGTTTDTTTTTQPASSNLPTVSPATGVALGLGIVALIIGAAFLGGPMGVLLALIFGPALALILIYSGVVKG